MQPFEPAFQYISCCYLSETVLVFRQRSEPVSIHLMLLFIATCFKKQKKLQGFNTSHVVIYREILCFTKRYNFGFNTSHVVIYPFLTLFNFLSFMCFNTSHVVIYPVDRFRRKFDGLGFNTSHVVIYLHDVAISSDIIKFQYISCCYLS